MSVFQFTQNMFARRRWDFLIDLLLLLVYLIVEVGGVRVSRHMTPVLEVVPTLQLLIDADVAHDVVLCVVAAVVHEPRMLSTRCKTIRIRLLGKHFDHAFFTFVLIVFEADAILQILPLMIHNSRLIRQSKLLLVAHLIVCVDQPRVYSKAEFFGTLPLQDHQDQVGFGTIDILLALLFVCFVELWGY